MNIFVGRFGQGNTSHPHNKVRDISKKNDSILSQTIKELM